MNMEVKRVYKVVGRINIQGERTYPWKSLFASGPLQVFYDEVFWIEPPPEAKKYGFGLTAFPTYERAFEFMCRNQRLFSETYELAIFECSAVGVKHPNLMRKNVTRRYGMPSAFARYLGDPEGIDDILRRLTTGHPDVDAARKWPSSTVMCDRVKLDRKCYVCRGTSW